MPRARRARKPARPRVRLETDARRAQLLQLARKAFSERSYDDVAIDDLARDAKISKGLLYHYFPTKRDLYVACLHQIAEELVQRMMAIPTDLPPPDRLRVGLDAYLEHVSQHSRAFVALMRGGIGSDPEVARVIESVRQRLADKFLDRSPLAQLARDAKLEAVVRGWLGFVEAASIDWCANPRLSRAELRELLASVLLAIIPLVASPTRL
jgi:AcrR family transcriptional regulator